MQRFYKGRTNNHLTWVMVDSADFASPESALSAATAIKIYGKLRGGTGTNLVSSGTGSLTNDITHVGASALGTYTIALVKADLSDASAAWYDQYIIALSATGAARQLLVVEGVIDDSTMSGLISDIQSAVALANSRVLLNQSRISDIASFLVVMSGVDSNIYSLLSDFESNFGSRVPKAVATASFLSDAHSDLKSAIGAITVTISASDVSDIASAVIAGMTFGSTISDIYSLLSDLNSNILSRVPKEVAARSQLSDLHSDLRSFLVVHSGVQSDIYSLLSNLQSGLADASDIASAVWAEAAGAAVSSRVLLILSTTSDIASNLSDLKSDFQSRVPKQVATASFLSDAHSDLKSAIGAITVTISASDVSDIASAVVAGLPITSTISDIYSLLSDLNSNFLSRVPKAVATNSQLSDLHSDLRSFMVVQSAVESNIYSLLSDLQSDFQSRVPKEVANSSQLSDIASDLRSLAAANHSAASDIYSLLSDLHSDVAVLSGVVSDVYSNLAAGVDVGSISGDASAAARLEAMMDGIVTATVNDAGATTTTFIGSGFTEATDDHFNGRLITFLTGALAGQQTDITDYTGATQTFTVTALTEAPANGVSFVIH